MTALSIEHVAHIDCPDELRDVPAWLMWRYEPGEAGDKPRRFPTTSTASGATASRARQRTKSKLATFDAARAAAAPAQV